MPRAGLLLAAMLLVAASCRGPTEVFPDLTIETQSLPAATENVQYEAFVEAEGGDGTYTWTRTGGQLPPGITLTTDAEGRARLAGTPTSAGPFSFTLEVRSGDGQTASRLFTLNVTGVLAIETPAVPPALAGAPYDVALSVSGGGGTPQWTVVSGSLPAGLTLTSGGRIQGTPPVPDSVVFTARVTAGSDTAERSFTLRVVPHQTDRFNITLFPVTPIAPTIRPHLAAAVARWEEVITGNLPAGALQTAQFDPAGCGGFIRLVDGTAVDDVMIILSIEPTDGPPGVLGQAGPCLFRTQDGRRTALGVVILNDEALLARAGDQEATHIISHEMGHVLGIGTLWDPEGFPSLLTGAGTNNPRYTGTVGVQEWQALGGTGDVPVENTGGGGTRDSHWRTSVFGTERMTGFSAGPGVFQPLSRVSVGSLADLGYQVDLDAADSFSLISALRDYEPHHFHEILIAPIGTLDADGRVRPLQRR